MAEQTEEQQVFYLQNAANQMLVFGINDQHLALIEKELSVIIAVFGDKITVTGTADNVKLAKAVLTALEQLVATGVKLAPADVVTACTMAKRKTLAYFVDMYREELLKDVKGRMIRVKNFGQHQYVNKVAKNDITFGIGPAGTGKTFLAVVLAVKALKQKQVERLVLTRPAVEAGESLGFLPGDLKEKVDPYLRPIYDALYAVLGKEHTERLIERGVIEIAPLAYMRGRTLDNAFVILDEAQNTTRAQMKMFLTRLGFGSKMIVNGDLTQIDLPKGHRQSGLVDALQVLQHQRKIAFVKFAATDVVRHPVVAQIIRAYAKAGQPKQVTEAEKKDEH